MRLGMVIDLDKCIGCQTCAVVCKVHNSQPPGIWWNRVFTQGTDYHQISIGEEGHYKMEYLPFSCQMCDNAPCQKICPTGATYTNEHGVVLVDYDRCIGCRSCMTACPYGVRQFNWQDPAKAKEEFGYDYGYPHEAHDGGKHTVYTPDRPTGVVEKCTFCAQYTEQGQLPACVKSCPANARIFGDLDDPDSPSGVLIREKQTHQLLPQYGTNPKVYYISSSKEKNREELD